MKKLSGGFGNGLEQYIATAYQVSVADASGLRFISSMYSSSMGMYMFVFCKCSSIRRTSNEVGNKQETKFHGTRRKFILGEVSKIKTVTICGSMKFAEEMKQISWELEAEKGVAVIQCVYNEQNEPIPEEVQKRLAAAHYKKIDICDAVYIVDIDGYIGTSVANEISYASVNGKELIFHSKQS